MKLVRYDLIPKSGIGTPIKSDTLAGQLCCLYRQRYGDQDLSDLLDQFRSGNPPFILTDALPQDMLPVPLVPPIPRKHFEQLRERQQLTPFQMMTLLKHFNKAVKWLPLLYWKQIRENFSMERLFQDFLQADDWAGGVKSRTEIELHNIIDRTTGTTLESGGLFAVENTWFGDSESQSPSPSSALLCIYGKVSQEFEETFDVLLHDLENTGYGRDSSIGKGWIVFQKSSESWDWLNECPNTNYWMNLSTFATTDSSHCGNAYYQLRAKFGKVWNGFGQNAPFKYPLLVFNAGSVFSTPVKGLAASVLQNVHIDPTIVQLTTPVLFPFHYQETV